MRRVRWIAVGALLSVRGACAGPPPGPVDQGPTYSCCAAADVDRIYHPGETLTIHWIVQGPPARGTGHQVELTARLSGPHGGVADLKSGAVAPATYAAVPVHPIGAAGEQPVSVIPIPGSAAPGYYDLTTQVAGSGFSFSGGSVIRIAAPSGAE